jgi:hypothetical protein
VESVWGMGVQARKSDIGFLRSGEIERCIREVMDGKERISTKRMLKNGCKWLRRLCRQEEVQTCILLHSRQSISQFKVITMQKKHVGTR